MVSKLDWWPSKEIIFILGAISTIDPEGPHQALNKVLVSQIRCSVVSLSAEVKIWKDLTEISGGHYYVPLDVPSVSEKLEVLARPPKDSRSRQATLIRMGFPVKEEKEKFVCPQCKVRVAALPTTCPVCRLPLVSAPHLARSYHHLFPPPPTAPYYEEDDDEDEIESKENEKERAARNQREAEIKQRIRPCVGCLEAPATIEEARQFVYCSSCNSSLCQFCDMFIDDNLHSCPGCC